MAKKSKRLSAKRVIALITAFLFVLSGMPLSSISAQAAVKKPTIAKSATLKVGTSKTIKISKGSYKIVSVKVSSSKKSVATVKASGKAAIKVTGKKAGKATITTRVKAKKGKTSKTFKLTTKVTVKKATKPEPTVDTSKTVNTQDELVAALADSSITQITIGQEATSITIPAGDYSKVDLIVDAPKASIVNNGTFKSITIKAVAANTWTEKGKGNRITTSSKNPVHIIIETLQNVASLMFKGTSSQQNLVEIKSGTVGDIAIVSAEPVKILTQGTSKIENVEVQSAANVNVTVSDTAEVSKVEVTGSGANVGINTSDNAKIDSVDVASSANSAAVNVKAEGSSSIKEVTTSAANSVTNVTANGSADVAKVAVNGSANASIGGTSNKVTEVDIKGASKDAVVTVTTTTVKIEAAAGTDNEKIINNQSGKALTTEVTQSDGTKKETTTAIDTTTPSSGGGSTGGGSGSSAVSVASVTISGQAKVGQTLSATAKDANNNTITGVTWQWYRTSSSSGSTADADKITGATNATYTPVDEDGGKYLTVKATATGSGYTGSASKTTESVVEPADGAHTITLSSSEGGTVASSCISASAGTIVTLTVIPDAGKKLKALTANQPPEGTLRITPEITLAGRTYSFTMGTVPVTVEGTFVNMDIDGIAIKNAPAQVTYAEGTSFDPTGLSIEATYEDESKGTIAYGDGTGFTLAYLNADDQTVDVSSGLTTEVKKVKVTYGGVYTTQNITVKGLTGIAVGTAPSKLTYAVDQYFDPTGLVLTLAYSDETTESVAYGTGNASDFTFAPTVSTALTTSNTEVTITYGGKSTTQAITVKEASDLSLTSAATVTLDIGGTSDITATATNDRSYESSDTDVATVDENGQITAVAAGTATITVTAAESNEMVEGTATVIVNVRAASDLTLTSEASVTLGVGATSNIEAIATNALSYQSSDKDVATVDANGQITAVAAGTATITVTAAETDEMSAGTAEVAVTVKAASDLTLTSAATVTLDIDGTSDITATATNDRSYESSDTDVATVDENGQITAVAAGTATITVTAAESNEMAEGTATVTVNVRAASDLNVSADKTTIGIGDTAQLTNAGTGAGDLTFESSDGEKATVDENGEVTGVAAGTVTITITQAATDEMSAGSDTVEITVKAASDLSVSAGKTVLDIDETTTITNAGAGTGDLTYSSDNEDVVTVENGTVTAVGAGTATVTIEQEETNDMVGNSATIDFTVRAASDLNVSADKTTIGVGDTAQLTNAGTGAGDLTFESSDGEKATVDENGEVTGVAAGTVTITITQAATDEMSAGSDTVEITVLSNSTVLALTEAGTEASYSLDGSTLTVPENATVADLSGKFTVGAGTATYKVVASGTDVSTSENITAADAVGDSEELTDGMIIAIIAEDGSTVGSYTIDVCEAV